MYIILVNQKEKDGIFVEKRTHAKHIILILLGSLILSFGIYNLNYQNNITEGGVLGLLLLLKNLFNIELSVANLIIDTALLIMAYKFFGKQFLIYSIIATFSFSSVPAGASTSGRVFVIDMFQFSNFQVKQYKTT